jgi:hypothetical protein
MFLTNMILFIIQFCLLYEFVYIKPLSIRQVTVLRFTFHIFGLRRERCLKKYFLVCSRKDMSAAGEECSFWMHTDNYIG